MSLESFTALSVYITGMLQLWGGYRDDRSWRVNLCAFLISLFLIASGAFILLTKGIH